MKPRKNGAFKPGKVFKKQKLYIFTCRDVLVIKGWPHPMGWQKSSKPNLGWFYVRPHIDMNWYDVSAKQKLLTPFASKKERFCKRQAEAVNMWIESIPLEVRHAIKGFKTRQYHLLSLIARCPGAIDIVKSNPALAFSLASNWVFHNKPPVKKPLRSAKALIPKKQSHIAGWLGYPETKSTVKILRKIPPNAVDIISLLYLRDALRDGTPMMKKMLSHVDRLNSTVLRIATDPELLQRVSVNFLNEAGLKSRNSKPTVYDLKDVLRMDEIMSPSIKKHVFKTLRELHQEHNSLISQINLKKRQSDLLKFRFPKNPPIIGTKFIMPLMGPEQVLEEGREMGHCIADYIQSVSVLYKKSFIYKIVKPERSTLCLSRIGNEWVIEGIKAKNNKEVGTQTIETVQKWFQKHCQPETNRKKSELCYHLDLF